MSMPSHWLSEDGQRAIEIIFDADVDAWVDVENSCWKTAPGEGTPDDFKREAVLNAHAENWLHERGITVDFDLELQTWTIIDWTHDKVLPEHSEDKSQALIAAVLAEEEKP